MKWVSLICVVLIVALLIYLFPVIKICGDSMYPTLNDGDIILGCRLCKSFKKKRVYVYRPPEQGKRYFVIKRLTHISRDTGKLFFEGDNSDYSYDSRMYGYISPKKVIARYVFTIYKKKGV